MKLTHTISTGRHVIELEVEEAGLVVHVDGEGADKATAVGAALVKLAMLAAYSEKMRQALEAL